MQSMSNLHAIRMGVGEVVLSPARIQFAQACLRCLTVSFEQYSTRLYFDFPLWQYSTSTVKFTIILRHVQSCSFYFICFMKLLRVLTEPGMMRIIQ